LWESDTIKLAGIISAEVANISHELISLREMCKKIEAGNGDKTIDVAMSQYLATIIDAQMNNMSTGIGRALHAESINWIFDDELQLGSIPSYLKATDLMTPKKTDRLHGALCTDPRYRDWFHRAVKDKPRICMEILGRVLQGGADNITAKEERTKLRPAYIKFLEKESDRAKQVQMLPLECLAKIANRVLYSTEKSRNNPIQVLIWRRQLDTLKSQLPEKEKEIEKLLKVIPEPVEPDDLTVSTISTSDSTEVDTDGSK
jgi:hypothetical protein